MWYPFHTVGYWSGESKRTALRSRTVKNLDEGSGELPRDLADALADLGLAPEEAQEDGFPIPGPELVSSAELLLKKLYPIWPHRFEVYPSPDGEIVIDAPNRLHSSVLLFCEQKGGVLCLVHIKGEQRSKRYSSSDTLPDEFLTQALGSLFEERA